MSFWAYFKQLGHSVQIVIVLSILILLLTIAFRQAAADNLIKVILALGAFSVGRFSVKRERNDVVQKEEALEIEISPPLDQDGID